MAKPKGLRVIDYRKALEDTAGIPSLAALKLGVSRQNVHQMIKRSPSLQRVLENVEDRMVDLTRGAIYQAIQAGDGKMARWYAERKLKHLGFGNSVHAEVTILGPDGVNEVLGSVEARDGPEAALTAAKRLQLQGR